MTDESQDGYAPDGQGAAAPRDESAEERRHRQAREEAERILRRNHQLVHEGAAPDPEEEARIAGVRAEHLGEGDPGLTRGDYSND